jgi:hypothetical protein
LSKAANRLDQVASSVAGAIEPKLRQSEIERAIRKPAASLTAYDFYLRALAQSSRFSTLPQSTLHCRNRRGRDCGSGQFER